MENRCVCCGDIIPEGRQVCRECEVNAMGTARNMSIKDYGITYEEGKKIEQYCKKARDYDQQLILQAAQSVYPEIAQFLFVNLTTGIGYDNISKICHIPMQRKDFQGYRRKTIETYNRYMMLNGKQII